MLIIKEIEYNRQEAVNYALKWGLKRNHNYFDFDMLGGDCTNFVSQCVFAGSGVMNFTPIMGWYFNSLNNRSPSWTGVHYFYNFMTMNKSVGPFGDDKSLIYAQIGDVIQFGDNLNIFYHSLMITKITGVPTPNNIFLTSHTFDVINKRMSDYKYDIFRLIHFNKVRKY